MNTTARSERRPLKVVIGGGGTAGHVFPALAVARVLTNRHGAEVHFVGTSHGLEATLVPAAGFPFTAVEATCPPAFAVSPNGSSPLKAWLARPSWAHSS